MHPTLSGHLWHCLPRNLTGHYDVGVLLKKNTRWIYTSADDVKLVWTAFISLRWDGCLPVDVTFSACEHLAEFIVTSTKFVASRGGGRIVTTAVWPLLL